MSRHDSLVRFRHILDQPRGAVAMIAGKTRQDLDIDRKMNLVLAGFNMMTPIFTHRRSWFRTGE